MLEKYETGQSAYDQDLPVMYSSDSGTGCVFLDRNIR